MNLAILQSGNSKFTTDAFFRLPNDPITHYKFLCPSLPNR